MMRGKLRFVVYEIKVELCGSGVFVLGLRVCVNCTYVYITDAGKLETRLVAESETFTMKPVLLGQKMELTVSSLPVIYIFPVMRMCDFTDFHHFGGLVTSSVQAMVIFPCKVGFCKDMISLSYL